MNDPTEQFRRAIASCGLDAPSEVHGDGKLHRFKASANKDKAGWYVLHVDGIPTGVFGDWRLGIHQTWCGKQDDEMTEAELQATRERIRRAQVEREREAERRRIAASERAWSIWADAKPAAMHPYLLRKQVKACGLRVGQWAKLDHETGEVYTLDNVLYIPMRDSTGKLHSLQGITESGDKHFLSGGRVKGCYHSIGRPSGRLIVVEGYATGATVQEATGDAVAVAFNAGNLEPVARALRAKYPCLSIVIAADDDWRTKDPKTGEICNPGLAAAKQAAAAVGGLLAMPDFSGLPRGERDTDFNDLARLAGAIKIGGAA